MSDLNWLRGMLAQWGLRNRARGIGYPSMSAETKAIYGRGGSFDGPYMPPDLERLDVAVARLEPPHKSVIVEVYTHWGTHEDHMIRLRLPKWSYYRRKNLAESRVNTLLQSLQPIN
jgi:hypothetical protein